VQALAAREGWPQHGWATDGRGQLVAADTLLSAGKEAAYDVNVPVDDTPAVPGDDKARAFKVRAGGRGIQR
jgi:hypothetical protein